MPPPSLALLLVLPLNLLMQLGSAGENTSSPYLAFQGLGFSPSVVGAALM